MMKRVFSMLALAALLLALTAPALAASWDDNPYPVQELEFRHDHKYDKFSSFAGPGRLGVYSEAGTYSNTCVDSLRGLWKESVDGVTYVYIEFEATPNCYRRVYTTNTYYSTTSYLPDFNLTGTPAVVNTPCTVFYGPGSDYNALEQSEVPAGTEVTVFFEEDGYLFCDLFNQMGHIRGYILAANVEGEAASDSAFCVECGGEIEADYKFCPKCGNPVK